jgi:hypothetical protein
MDTKNDGIKLTVSIQDGHVVVDFDRLAKKLALTKDQAVQLGKALESKANEIKEQL